MIVTNLPGKGINVSQNIKYDNIENISIKPDGLYKLPNIDYESLDFIIDDDLEGKKFYLILLHEWFFSLKKGGALYIKTNKSPRKLIY